MERIKRRKEKNLRHHWCHNRSRYYLAVCLTLSSIGLIGCGVLKKASIVSLSAGGGALAGTVLSGGVAAPILGATTTAFVADVVTATTLTGSKTMNDCAPDNFWSLLGSLVEMGGWLLILVFVLPMVLGWILPGPLEKKKKGSA